MNMEHYNNQFNSLKPSFVKAICESNKLESFERFRSSSWPTSRDEAWRYAKLNRIEKTDFNNYSINLDRPLSLVKSTFNFPVTHLVFRNGIFDKQLSQLSREAMDYIKFKEHGCISPLPVKSKLTDSPFFNLNLSFNLETFYIDIPDGAIVKEPIVFNYVYDSDSTNMYHPQLDIIVGKSSQVKFIELHSSEEKGESLINPLTKLRQQENSKVKYLRLNDMQGKKTKNIGHFVSQQQKDSSHHFVSLNLGGEFNRIETEFFHEGESSHLEVNGLYHSIEKEQINYVSRIFHEKGFGESHQLYKGILDGESSSLFDGLVYIAPQAQKVNSSQMNKNLILSDKAEVNTKPQLDINADDVKAAHGATVSELNEEEIFYLMSRGISKKQAQTIIERAFIEEIILKIGDLNIQKWLSDKIKNKQRQK